MLNTKLKNISPFTFDWIQADKLTFRSDYQRNVNIKNANDIQEKFNPIFLTPIRVSKRNGQFFVVAGQHRVSACMERFGKDVLLPAQIYSGLTYEQEADIVAFEDEQHKNLTAGQKTNARFEGKHTEELEFKRICQDEGFSVDYSTNHTGTLYAVQNSTWVLKNVYLKHGEKYLREYLQVLDNAYHGDPGGMRKPVESGVNMFMALYYDDLEFDLDRLAKTLPSSPEMIKNNAADDMRHRGIARYAYAIGLFYNKGKRKKLDLDRIK